MTTTSTNVAEIIKDLIRTADSVEYADLAAAVMDRLAPEDYEEALRQILPEYCRSIARTGRRNGPVTPPPPASFPTRLSGAASKGAVRTPGEQQQRETTLQPVGSWKVTAIRDGWQQRLSEVYSTNSGNKRLGDFTYADLVHQSDILEKQADQKRAKARGWRRLAESLEAAGVTCVRDLPAEVLMHALGAAA